MTDLIAADALGRPVVSIVGQEVNTQTWTSVVGAFSFDIRGPVGMVLASWVRGLPLELMMGFAGWTEDRYQRISFGMLKGLRRSGLAEQYTVECWDIVAGLESRMSMTPAQAQLFYGVSAATTVKAGNDYAAGNSSLHVTSPTGFERQNGGTYLMKVTPDSGDDFYLTATGLTVDQFTGAAGGALGTTDGDATAGNAVTEMAYLKGNPADIYRRMLTSTGTAAANGSFDVYPKSWGYGIPHDMIDPDIARVKSVALGASLVYHWWTTEGVANGFSWIQDRLSNAGIWPCIHEGQLSLRAGQNPNASTLWHSGITINDDDVVSLIEHDLWDTEHAIEYSQLSVPNLSGLKNSTVEAKSSLPSQPWTTLNGTTAFLPTPNWWNTNEATDVTDRLSAWYTRVPERIGVRCRGWRLMGLVPGDIIDVDLPLLVTTKRDRNGFRATTGRAMVTQVSPSMVEPITDIAFKMLPDYAGQ